MSSIFLQTPQKYQAAAFSIHPDYDDDVVFMGDDLAMIKVAEPIKLGKHVQPVNHFGNAPKVGQNLTTVTWDRHTMDGWPYLQRLYGSKAPAKKINNKVHINRALDLSYCTKHNDLCDALTLPFISDSAS